MEDIDVNAFWRQHRNSDRICTLAVARPSGRNVILPISEKGNLMKDSVARGTDAWTSAGIYAFSPKVFNYFQGSYELDYFVKGILADQKQVSIYKTSGLLAAGRNKKRSCYDGKYVECGDGSMEEMAGLNMKGMQKRCFWYLC